ncbi:expressed unknown protein [Seminavis robusta]|uniref:Uncharacterized protein n=1 Tax=Seminavis robusta TaxID=568900 RepID=A0A9N8E086_9STRA|nr:expressed unknown protein [Seminavis robusta]|eukprot:Sro420_g139340.1 n/a (388) ;mRNA; f:39487-40763
MAMTRNEQVAFSPRGTIKKRFFAMALVGVCLVWVGLIITDVNVMRGAVMTATAANQEESGTVGANNTGTANVDGNTTRWSMLAMDAFVAGSSVPRKPYSRILDSTADLQTTAEADTTEAKAPSAKTISLVTSFFADALVQEDPHPHLAEIQASILNNLHNPYFDQLVVILDGSSSQSNCTTFYDRIGVLQRQYAKYWKLMDRHPKIVKPSLTCVDRPESQPNYYEMFTYATDPNIVTGDIIVLSNADQAFDDTVGEVSRTGIAGRCGATTPSWDGYVFHRLLVQGKLQPQDFMRNTLTESGRAFFKMNESGGENAGLWALLAQIPEANDANGCALVRTWHFHHAKKMHAHKTDEKYWDNPESPYRVPKPHRRPTVPLDQVLLKAATL